MMTCSLLLAGALGSGPASSQPAPPGQPIQLSIAQRGGDILINSEGNELVARRSAPVLYTSVTRLLEEITAALPARAAAIRVVRAAPDEMVEYVLCVTEEGRLVLGEQRRAFDYAARRYVFVRGEMGRGYSPLDQPGPWTWLLEIPVSRERHATLRLQAGGAGWPVEVVTIDAVGRP